MTKNLECWKHSPTIEASTNFTIDTVFCMQNNKPLFWLYDKYDKNFLNTQIHNDECDYLYFDDDYKKIPRKYYYDNVFFISDLMAKILLNQTLSSKEKRLYLIFLSKNFIHIYWNFRFNEFLNDSSKKSESELRKYYGISDEVYDYMLGKTVLWSEDQFNPYNYDD